jgi:hypothetical protein
VDDEEEIEIGPPEPDASVRSSWLGSLQSAAGSVGSDAGGSDEISLETLPTDVLQLLSRRGVREHAALVAGVSDPARPAWGGGSPDGAQMLEIPSAELDRLDVLLHQQLVAAGLAVGDDHAASAADALDSLPPDVLNLMAKRGIRAAGGIDGAGFRERADFKPSPHGRSGGASSAERGGGRQSDPGSGRRDASWLGERKFHLEEEVVEELIEEDEEEPAGIAEAPVERGEAEAAGQMPGRLRLFSTGGLARLDSAGALVRAALADSDGSTGGSTASLFGAETALAQPPRANSSQSSEPYAPDFEEEEEDAAAQGGGQLGGGGAGGPPEAAEGAPNLRRLKSEQYASDFEEEEEEEEEEQEQVGTVVSQSEDSQWLNRHLEAVGWSPGNAEANPLEQEGSPPVTAADYATVRTRPGRLSALSVPHRNRFFMALLYGRAGRPTAKNGGFRPGQRLSADDVRASTPGLVTTITSAAAAAARAVDDESCVTDDELAVLQVNPSLPALQAAAV